MTRWDGMVVIPADTLALLLEHVQEWVFDDNPSDHSVCQECRWDSREHGGMLGHEPGCALRAALDELEAVL